MKTQLTKKYRSSEQIAVLQKDIIAAIENEVPFKGAGDSLNISKSYAYRIAQYLGYYQMIISQQEREMIRKCRGTDQRFKRGKRAA